jgi:predicted unusual protein kinase regulating ubiquinone biosynthesis (AarF/ABC1/UbiB family)
MQTPEDEEQGAPPGGARDRGLAAARAGVRIGSNYARYLTRRAAGTPRAEARGEMHARNAEDLFTELSKLRGTALKMAQGLSMEPGFLPEQFAETLARAQYDVPAMGPALVRRLVTQAFGKAPEEVFAAFDDRAFAAASLGQVHCARMQDGTDVVVKVQYPNVRESVDSDLRLVRGLAGRFLDAGSIDPYLEEVRERMMEETDYRIEGANIEEFARRFEGSPLVTPRWVASLTTERVLTMTYLEGQHLKEYLATGPSQAERDRYGQLLWDTIHGQVAGSDLRVHADAHPGNFLFREDGRLGILDFGCIKTFPEGFRDGLIRLYRARMHGEEADKLKAYKELDMLPDDLDDEGRAYVLELLDLLGGVIESLYREDMYDFGSGQLLEQFQALMPKFTGREAFKHRRPIGSQHFVFVNRLLAGMLSMLTRLEARIDTRSARVMLEGLPLRTK